RSVFPGAEAREASEKEPALVTGHARHRIAGHARGVSGPERLHPRGDAPEPASEHERDAAAVGTELRFDRLHQGRGRPALERAPISWRTGGRGIDLVHRMPSCRPTVSPASRNL